MAAVADQAQPPITLEQGVREAVRGSAQVRAARAALETARAQAERDRPIARPTVTAIASGTAQGPRVDFQQPDGQLATVLPEAVGRLDLIIEQPLYRAGLGPARERYSAERTAAELEYRKAVADLVLALRKAFIDVLRADAGVRAARDGVDAAERSRKLVDDRVAAGQARPIDAQTAQAQSAEAQAALTQAEGSASLARYSLNRLLGRALREPIAVAAVEDAPAVPASPDEAVARGLRGRPELLLLDQNLVSARAGIALARSQTQPSVTARGQLTEQTPSAFLHEHYYAATLEVRWPLSDGGKSRQDAREARSQADRVEALLDDARQGIGLDVLHAWESMRAAQGRISLARVQRDADEAAELVAEKAYEVGRGTILEVQAAQREVRAARAAELSALYDLHAANADFLYAQGDALNGLAVSPAGHGGRP
ncbi:MAG TPA: TolC family protein [Chthonomonadaceae bacterium]|nr:TolC family protein [Chthonomonadaceae bacterium]